ncbi:MAG: hypothetical protein ACOH2K_13910 [Burkholderiaceae bacterium]
MKYTLHALLLPFGIAMLLSACASGPAVPDWQMNAQSGIERAVSAYLSGNDRVEVQEFAKARSEIASTGQVALVARAELIRCASRVASLVLEDCAEFDKLRQDAAAPERAYADYLAGRVQPQDIALLPTQHQGVMRAGADPAATVAGISDPLSRLVAAGVLLRSDRASPAVLALAVETASAQGWRRPLLAWLGVQSIRAEQAGATAEALRLRRRMDLVQQAKP